MFSFKVTCYDKDSYGRCGYLTTAHSTIKTPVFMPVGTHATVKGMTPEEVEACGAEILLCNAYHLYLRPGMEVVKAAGGLHRFMNWHGSILTDSGGFQVFSLAKLNSIDDNGVYFQSHIDGSQHLFTPEKSMAVQIGLGADIIMAFDQCVPYPVDYTVAKEAVLRTTRWAERSLAVHNREDQTLFGIVQGGVYPRLRHQSLADLMSLNFPGFAIGGLSVGEPKDEMYMMLEELAPRLPRDKPRYLMGVGTPEDLLEGVSQGIDMFDCVFPTRTGRTGSLFTETGRINIRNATYARDFGPPDARCNCQVCRSYTCSYLHHLFRQKEILGLRLATYHNLFFLHHLMTRIREAIETGSFITFKESFLQRYLSDKGRT